MLTLILVFLLGVALLGWHRCHEELREARLDRVFLEEMASELERQLDASRDARRRSAPAASYWGNSTLDRLWRDIQAAPPLDLVRDDPDLPEAS